ncbi:MAG: ABC transporter permease [Chloroflexi bacterium]|nr:ABC transporter permease [Chloroflexota bacterium]MCY3589854.1 ABC transporter permease [Chloroflexota bacterium]MCY3686235.1 ABC transporter permease [Chloroflexota bacterium]MDE2708856.1 ABC transporter permease [Chloroflexota bacterium]
MTVQFWNYLVVRLLQAVVVVFVVVSIVFFVARLVGNPESFLLPYEATDAEIETIRDRLGLNDTLIVQYGNFLWDLVNLDFGTSYRGAGTSTIAAIGERAVNTLKLTVAGMIFAVGLSIPLGIAAALRRGKVTDWIARFLAVFGQATPSFWLGLMVIFFFAVELRWFPTGGAEGFRSLILPALSLGLLEMAAIMRLTRSGMIDVMGSDFITTARAKGLRERTVIMRHALRHALLPVVTILGLGLGRLIAGAVIIEVVFAWPGIGRLIIDSIVQSDYPMVQTAIIVLAASIALANALVDVSYRLIDPRIRAGAI